jgi:hypothetical protein
MMITWFIRRWFWNFIAWIKFALNKPLKIPVPPVKSTPIQPVPLSLAIVGVPIDNILVCAPGQIPSDERSAVKSGVYKLQVWLYSAFSAMQAGLPPVDPDPRLALKRAYTWLHRTKFAPPVLPAEFLGSPDLGSLAVRGPYEGYLQACGDGIFQWDLTSLGRFEVHSGLRPLGVRVLFKVEPLRRGLLAYQIDTELGSSLLNDADWELSKKIALCAVSAHTSLVRHFNWVHLAGGGALGIAIRNRLPGTHPVTRLLWPMTYDTQQNADMVTRGQMLPGGDFETTFPFSFVGMCQLFEQTHGGFRIAHNDPEVDAQARGVLGQGFDTPTHDNLRALFAVMHEHARHYTRIYYSDGKAGSGHAAVAQDAALLEWLDELNALTPNGVEVNRANVTFDNLSRLLARFMYMQAVAHELLGGFLWNYQLWTHRQPVRVAVDGRREPLDVYQRLINANYNLNVHRRELIHDFTNLALDAPGKAAMEKFNAELVALQASMELQPWAAWKLYPRALKVSINA